MPKGMTRFALVLAVLTPGAAIAADGNKDATRAGPPAARSTTGPDTASPGDPPVKTELKKKSTLKRTTPSATTPAKP